MVGTEILLLEALVKKWEARRGEKGVLAIHCDIFAEISHKVCLRGIFLESVQRFSLYLSRQIELHSKSARSHTKRINNAYILLCKHPHPLANLCAAKVFCKEERDA